jgi:phosphoglycolate phosphatase-like HAD superfamily hydrolase
MKDVVIFDLDGTLALVEHRFHFIEGRKKDWHGYFAACVLDPPNLSVVSVCQALYGAGYEIWIVSGRSDEVRKETVNWLRKHDVQYHRLVMRSAGDKRPDDFLKRQWLINGTLPRERMLMVFDDRDKVVAMWRREGVTCAQVAPGDF